ncbi:MAG: DNA polymerase III subunit beta [Bacteroidales bacterium]|nr:DNA polymerase III subunit beta [Bacteroidales bacterium]
MKFSVPSKTLYSLASGVSKVINAKNALTVLNNFRFALSGEELTITGSDIENALTARVAVAGAEGEGVFCIDARRLVDLLKELPDQPLEFDINEDTLEISISYANGHYSMVGAPGDQYPEYKKEEGEAEPVEFECDAEQILKGIDNTLFAIGTDDFHPQMMGIFLDIMPDNITFVATDTRKLVRFINRNCAPGVSMTCIMPLKPATIFKTIFSKQDKVQITITSKSATFRSEVFTFNCRFIKGRFPDYNKVIPKNNPYTLRVDRMRFLNAVRRVGVFVDPGYGMERFRITNDLVHIKSHDPSLCTMGSERLDCEYEGPELVIGFNAPFLIEICNVLPTEQIIVKLSDPSRPGVFCPTENEEGTDLLMLLMPMNVAEF